MAKYHINDKGDAGECKAAAGKCPFGDDDKHYTSAGAARAAYEELMAQRERQAKLAYVKKRFELHWRDLTAHERGLLERQDTAVVDHYFEDRETSVLLTHERVWPVLQEWDDFMMGKHGDYANYQDSYYDHEGDIYSKNYTNSYDAKVRWLRRIGGTRYPLFEEIVGQELDTVKLPPHSPAGP